MPPIEREYFEWKQQVDRDLYHGNAGGKPGLCTRMEVMEGNWDRVNKNLSKITWLLVAALLGIIANIVMNHVHL